MTTFSIIFSSYFYSFSSFFSFYCYCSIRMEKKSCHPKLFEIKCQNIIPLLLYIAFCWYKHQTIPSTSTLHSPNLKTFFLIEVNMRLSFIFGAQIFFLFFLLSSSILFARELTNEQGKHAIRNSSF